MPALPIDSLSGAPDRGTAQLQHCPCTHKRSYRVIKSRFQCLKHLRVTPPRASDIVVACVVLHNIACLRKEKQPRIVAEEDWGIEAIFEENQTGRIIRDTYANNYFA